MLFSSCSLLLLGMQDCTKSRKDVEPRMFVLSFVLCYFFLPLFIVYDYLVVL